MQFGFLQRKNSPNKGDMAGSVELTLENVNKSRYSNSESSQERNTHCMEQGSIVCELYVKA